MIIRRKPGKTIYWGENLDPDDLAGSADGWLKVVDVKNDVASIRANGGNLRVATVGETGRFGAVVMTLVTIDERGAHWDVQAPRHIRILRDDAKQR